MDPEERLQKLRDGLVLLDFAVWCAMLQVQGGRKYVFEHPFKAKSWKRQNLVALQGHVSLFDQCRFGLTSPLGTPIQKATCFKSNLQQVADSFDGVRCLRNHKHRQIEGSELGIKLSVHAQHYPQPLCQCLARAIHSYVALGPQ